jgi:hypothetical protein
LESKEKGEKEIPATAATGTFNQLPVHHMPICNKRKREKK